MLGVKDEELTVRWVQYGVFSPVMRLHSSKTCYRQEGTLTCSLAQLTVATRQRCSVVLSGNTQC
jgi:alpha-glucosidase (family GH31 glycosyl hydrolase)